MLFQATLLSLLLSLPLLPCLAASADTPSWLARAEALSLKIEGDDDLQAAAMLRLVELRMAKPEYAAAEALCTRLPGYRRGIAYARLATVRDGAESKRCLEEAFKVLQRSTGAAADALRAAIIRSSPELLHQACGKEISDPELRLSLELELELAAKPLLNSKEVDALKARIEAVAKGNPFPPAVALAQQQLQQAVESTSSSREQQLGSIEATLALAQLSHVAYPEFTFSAAAALWKLGEQERSEQLFKQAAVETQRMSLGYEARYLSYARWAVQWAATGQVEKAHSLLKEAEAAAIQNLAAPEIAAVLVVMAQAWHSMGQAAEAERLCGSLLQHFSQNPNLRLKQLAALEVIHFYLQHDSAPKEEVRQALSAVEQATHP